MNKKWLVLLFLMMAESVFSQRFSLKLWHKGYAVTIEQDTIQGYIKYNIEDNYITIKKGDKYIPLSNHKLLKFLIEDENLGVTRTFYSLPYNLLKGKKPYLIFEILMEAPQTLMAREKIVTQYNQSPSYYSSIPFYSIEDRLVYDIYFLDPKGRITPFLGKKRELYAYVGPKYERRINEYIKKEKLKVTNRDDLIRVFRFYNKIKYNNKDTPDD